MFPLESVTGCETFIPSTSVSNSIFLFCNVSATVSICTRIWFCVDVVVEISLADLNIVASVVVFVGISLAGLNIAVLVVVVAVTSPAAFNDVVAVEAFVVISFVGLNVVVSAVVSVGISLAGLRTLELSLLPRISLVATATAPASIETSPIVISASLADLSILRISFTSVAKDIAPPIIACCLTLSQPPALSNAVT